MPPFPSVNSPALGMRQASFTADLPRAIALPQGLRVAVLNWPVTFGRRAGFYFDSVMGQKQCLEAGDLMQTGSIPVGVAMPHPFTKGTT